MMQTDVLSTHLNSGGAAIIQRTRLKGIILVGTATGGTLNIWDSSTAPIVASYGRSGTLVTVTSTGHGLSTGQAVGITFATATGVSATNGNYPITVVDVNTFTITDINTGTIATSTVCNYVVGTAGNPTTWLMSLDTVAVTGGGQVVYYTIPGEGMMCHTGIYCTFSNMTGLTVFYG